VVVVKAFEKEILGRQIKKLLDLNLNTLLVVDQGPHQRANL